MTEIILHLSSGQGPAECEWVVAQLARLWAKDATAAGLSCLPVEPVEGPVASVLLRVEGAEAEAFAAARIGSIRWVGTSPFRPLHKRRNWFVGVSRISLAEDGPELRDSDIRYQMMRASGPGGQHVNKTDSAVRATHLPSGLTTFSQDQRSQFANRRIARLKLALLLDEQRREQAAAGKRGLWNQNHDLERGNAVLSYRGEKFAPG
jgi:peptide chain release factor